MLLIKPALILSTTIQPYRRNRPQTFQKNPFPSNKRKQNEQKNCNVNFFNRYRCRIGSSICVMHIYL